MEYYNKEFKFFQITFSPNSFLIGSNININWIEKLEAYICLYLGPITLVLGKLK